MESELISIIIPVYNSEKFILKLLECLKKQTYQYFEIIVVDDGSTDRTSIIVKEFISNNRNINIKYFFKINGGVSSARNFGIEKANGKFLLFLDSDDLVKDTILEKLYKKINETECELVVSNAKIVIKSKETVPRLKVLDNNIISYMTAIFSKKVALKRYQYQFEFCRSSWAKLYISKIVKENKVLFDEKMYLFEDAFFNLTYLQYVKKIEYVDEPLYIYLKDNGGSGRFRESLESENDYKIDKINELTNSMDNSICIAKNIYYFDLLCRFVQMYLNNDKNTFKKKEKRAKLEEILKKENFSSILSWQNFKYYNYKKKLIYILFKLKQYNIIIFALK